MQYDPEVLVIGGGVIGMACAAELAEAGAQVTVIDQGREPGRGCSYGNAGWITPCFAMPLPMPGMLLKSVRWLLDPASPLHIKPSMSPLFLSWMVRFLASMSSAQAMRSIEALTEISRFSLDAYRDLDQKTGGSIQFEQKGLLMVSGTSEGLASAREEMELVSRHGIPGRLMSAAEVKSFEPSIQGDVLGGVYFPSEAHAEPFEVVRALARIAAAKGAKFYGETEAYDFEIVGDEIRRVRTTRGWIAPKKVVLATGSWSHSIAARLGVRAPILGGKGYSLIYPEQADVRFPKVPIMYVEKKIAITPRQGSLRVAGTLELVHQDWSISPKRVKAIEEGAAKLLGLPKSLESSELWRGLRPCTPDGVPMIGKAPRLANLWLAAGHQMLGLQSAPGTGRLVADLVLKRKPTFDPKPFFPGRF